MADAVRCLKCAWVPEGADCGLWLCTASGWVRATNADSAFVLPHIKEGQKMKWRNRTGQPVKLYSEPSEGSSAVGAVECGRSVLAKTVLMLPVASSKSDEGAGHSLASNAAPTMLWLEVEGRGWCCIGDRATSRACLCPEEPDDRAPCLWQAINSDDTLQDCRSNPLSVQLCVWGTLDATQAPSPERRWRSGVSYLGKFYEYQVATQTVREVVEPPDKLLPMGCTECRPEQFQEWIAQNAATWKATLLKEREGCNPAHVWTERALEVFFGPTDMPRIPLWVSGGTLRGALGLCKSNRNATG